MSRPQQDNKYAFPVGLKDLDFDVDYTGLARHEMSFPFQRVDQAEKALQAGLIRPRLFLEEDGTQHQVAAFSPLPVGYSGFMNCATHSLALTDKGVFAVGRYPAIRFLQPGRYWQWFLHRRLARPEQVLEWLEKKKLTAEQLIFLIYHALTGAH